VKTFTLVGGRVTILAANPSVSLVGAVPDAGYSVSVEEDGPQLVRVEFKSGELESQFEARWDDGELVIDIDDDHDDH
jgi:hypothetical protein